MITSESGLQLAAPQVRDVRESLAKVLGDDFEQVWQEVCSLVPVKADADSVTSDEFDRLLDALVARGSVARVIAMSWKIRRTAARKLAALGR